MLSAKVQNFLLFCSSQYTRELEECSSRSRGTCKRFADAYGLISISTFYLYAILTINKVVKKRDKNLNSICRAAESLSRAIKETSVLDKTLTNDKSANWFNAFASDITKAAMRLARHKNEVRNKAIFYCSLTQLSQSSLKQLLLFPAKWGKFRVVTSAGERNCLTIDGEELRRGENL